MRARGLATTSIVDLPLDTLAHRVLPHLPLESVLRMSYVSRAWRHVGDDEKVLHMISALGALDQSQPPPPPQDPDSQPVAVANAPVRGIPLDLLRGVAPQLERRVRAGEAVFAGVVTDLQMYRANYRCARVSRRVVDGRDCAAFELIWLTRRGQGVNIEIRRNGSVVRLRETRMKGVPPPLPSSISKQRHMLVAHQAAAAPPAADGSGSPVTGAAPQVRPASGPLSLPPQPASELEAAGRAASCPTASAAAATPPAASGEATPAAEDPIPPLPMGWVLHQPPPAPASPSMSPLLFHHHHHHHHHHLYHPEHPGDPGGAPTPSGGQGGPGNHHHHLHALMHPHYQHGPHDVDLGHHHHVLYGSYYGLPPPRRRPAQRPQVAYARRAVMTREVSFAADVHLRLFVGGAPMVLISRDGMVEAWHDLTCFEALRETLVEDPTRDVTFHLPGGCFPLKKDSQPLPLACVGPRHDVAVARRLIVGPTSTRDLKGCGAPPEPVAPVQPRVVA
eukprot:CAMPEP_0185158662 /NCGR_PEP_ID=MMETSP1139-20130426/2548_1 /TAXON_ID=298111 /ORGANISM="Pavlova sp., Strain CCMP459" /LENGTH=504 /DNA_ID=CAMNT_0027723807 /DNA_START=14 /DNA_END=1528 /DNA_ORIENTATION=+